jgi:uncharacterized protein (TIGR03084 family)
MADLRAEQAALAAELDGIGAGWELMTPADGWTVADTVAHLLVAEQAALLAVALSIDPLASGLSSAQPHPRGDALLAAWKAACAEACDAFAAKADGDRVPWGGRAMSARSLATARLMESWAHGLDCLAALGREPTHTARLRHIAWLGHRTLPHAFAVAGLTPRADPGRLRLELTGPNGESWTFGPADSPEIVAGPALDWCRVATHRLRAGDPMRLHAQGELAGAALQHARAFL